MWLKEEGFKESLRLWWRGLSFVGSLSFVLASKLKALKVILRSWNREVFGLVDLKKAEALRLISFWDSKASEYALSEEEVLARDEAREDYRRWVLKEEVFWRQNSREVWLKEGDGNTRFFHRLANVHRRRNCFQRLKVNGRWLSVENGLSHGVVEAFKQLLCEGGGRFPFPEDLSVPNLGSREAEFLESPFLESEVWAALSDLGEDKAPGPDGFSLAFWRFGWDFLKVEVMGFFNDFFERGRFVKELNATFLVLIPKRSGAVDLKDFRPISLVGSLYKLLAKVLANRLKRVLPLVISEAQNAFVGGRQILDAVLIANEAVDSRLKSSEPGVLCKLDVEKAYDHVNWEFLLFILRRMGFGDKWIRWIEWCISTASFSVLINGAPSGFFHSSRGLRQGDPLSPYLFVIVMEAFSCLLNKAILGGYLSEWKVSGRSGSGESISHLLFADDTLVFCEASQDQMTHLCWLLMWFEAISGLKINLDKSELYPVGEVEDIEILAASLGCKVGMLPTSYLGMPLGAQFNDVAVWDGVEERFMTRLAGWKRQYISKGGRLTLIRSTLSSMPIYFMSLFSLPKRVGRRLERIMRNFLWGGGEMQNKLHLVRWETVCLEKKKGGLGVRRLATLNKALLGKWSWRFAVEREALWRKVICSKYGEEQGGWRSKEVRVAFGVGLWRFIRKQWNLLGDSLEFKVGNGQRIRFWRDKWCGDLPLRELFPALFAIAADKDAWVADLWNWEGAGGGWDPRFVRSFNDWEVVFVEQLLALLQVERLSQEVDDSIVWTRSASGSFSVKTLFCSLEAPSSVVFPCRAIWSSIAPPRVAFFAWEAAWGRVLTQDQLQRRGFSLPSRCCLCLSMEETVDHILIHCATSSVLWQLLLSLFSVSWVFPASVKDLLVGWNGGHVAKHKRKIWRVAPLCIFWSVWKERNSILFDNSFMSVQRMKSMFLQHLWFWGRARAGVPSRSLGEFIDWVGPS